MRYEFATEPKDAEDKMNKVTELMLEAVIDYATNNFSKILRVTRVDEKGIEVKSNIGCSVEEFKEITASLQESQDKLIELLDEVNESYANIKQILYGLKGNGTDLSKISADQDYLNRLISSQKPYSWIKYTEDKQ